MDKNKIKEELKKKLKQEMSATGTGASFTPGGDFVASKYAYGKRDNKGTPSDWKAAPSIPNRPSKAMDYKELWEAKQEWAVQNIAALINDYATKNNLTFKSIDKKQQTNQYGSKKTIYIYKLGDKDLVMIDDKAAGAPRLNDFKVIIGTMEPGTTVLKNTLSVSKFGSYGTEDITKMLDKAFENKELNENSGFKSGKEFINIKLQKYPKALAKINQLIDMIGEDKFTIDVAEWIFDFFNNASFEQSINEGYAQFRNETKTRTKPEQFHSAVKDIKKKVNEINRLFEYMNRLQSELSESEGGLKYKKYTERSIQQIKESTKQLFFKSTKLK